MPNATIRQCAILVGGLGTRLGALTAATPKPLLPRAGRPFVAWLMREMQRFGVEEFLLLTGHLSEEVERSAAAIARLLPKRATVRICREPVRAGTGGAVWHARDALAERFLLCNGDSLFDGNAARLLAEAARDPADAVGRLMLRRLDDASRYGVVRLDGDRIAAFAERPAPGEPGTINGGVYAFRKSLVDALAPVCSLEGDVMPRLAAQGALRGTVGQGYFRDIGVPDDYAAAEEELPRVLRRRALFLDRDGVLDVDHGYVGSRDRWDWVPGAREAVAEATARGWHVFVVTNQSGIARGKYAESDLAALHAWMADEIRAAGGTVDDIRHCPFHVDATVPAYRAVSDWRKPAPGMLLDLLRAWELDPARCVMVGDQATDVAAGEAAGMRAHRFPGGDLRAFLAPILE